MESIDYHKKALACYERAKKFTVDFLKESGKTLTKDGETQIKICEEMIEMLPLKITKIMQTPWTLQFKANREFLIDLNF